MLFFFLLYNFISNAMAMSTVTRLYTSLPKFFFDTCRNEEKKRGTIKKNEVLERTQAQRTTKKMTREKEELKLLSMRKEI
jgi:hypothetical protein